MDYEAMLNDAYENVDKNDVCERFEIKKVVGHHEGGKTIISNFIQVSTCLRRNPEHFAKFLFKELAAPGEIAGDRLIMTRKVSSQHVNEKIEKYAKEYVLCPNCKKPDTEIINEAGKKYLRCLACGNKKEIHN